jgi:Putative zinc-finger
MTRCSGDPAEEMAARYLAGELSEPESEEFENHYLGCDPCHRMVMTAQALATELASEPAAIPALTPRREAVKKASAGKILRFPFPIRLSGQVLEFGALAAAVLIAAVLTGVFLKQSGTFDSDATAENGGRTTATPNQKAVSQPIAPVNQATKDGPAVPETEIASLADVHLPGYQPGQLRDAESSDSGHLEFAAGMASYAKGDCRGALTHLARTPAGSEDALSAGLYSGICHFDQRAFDQAQASFKHVIAAGDTPQLETAEYFQAQTQILKNDAAGARNWLTRTVALKGDYEQRARQQLAALSRATQKP